MEKNTELLSTQMSAEETDKQQSGELITRVNIPDTPFTAIKMGDEDGYFLTLGKYRLTKGNKTLNELQYRTEGVDWNLLINVIGVIVTEDKNQK